MALAAINVKKPREAQIWNCCTGNPIHRISPDSNSIKSMGNGLEMIAVGIGLQRTQLSA